MTDESEESEDAEERPPRRSRRACTALVAVLVVLWGIYGGGVVHDVKFRGEHDPWAYVTCEYWVLNTLGPDCVGDVEGPVSKCERRVDAVCKALFPMPFVMGR